MKRKYEFPKIENEELLKQNILMESDSDESDNFVDPWDDVGNEDDWWGFD